MVKKGPKNTAEEVITLDTIENKRLHELAIDQGVSAGQLKCKLI
jgi:hypothetical protein